MASYDPHKLLDQILEAWYRSMHGACLALFRYQHGWRRFFMLDWYRLRFARFPKRSL